MTQTLSPLVPTASCNLRQNSLSRRHLLGALAALPLALDVRAAPARPEDTGPIRIAQSTDLSGPLADLGQAMSQGAKAYFSALNAKGGINGRLIELTVADDGYDIQRAVANAKSFIEDRSYFAIFNCLGTPMVESMLPSVIESGMPFFSPITGAMSAHPKNVRNVFNIRASYADETAHLVKHLATIGTKNVAIVYQNNSFGSDVLSAARQSLAKHQLKDTDIVSVENNSANASAAATQIAGSQAEAVIIGLAGKPAVDFVKALRQQRKAMPVFALSVVGASATLKAMGDDAFGITVSQIVPLPGMVPEFQQAWKASSATMEPSHQGLEGYLNAQVFAEILRRAGRNPTRSSFIESAWSLKRYDLGSHEVSFSDSAQSASRYVDLTMVGRNGRFIH
jgi:branched-chain amino acid transport system substrate-binding protein